ncbi:MAG: response regulator [Magnetococcales bacterium]|nr:response regulator [Magnetococcales bacterium]
MTEAVQFERLKILIVDDMPANIQVLNNVLGSRFKVHFATNGADALKQVKNNKPDLILLDIIMPDMDGYAVCRLLKENPETREIPVIFVTARNEVGDETRGFELGAVDYITKPISPPVVLARVRTHLRLHSALQELERQNTELIEANRLRKEVERITRHDLISPLSGIIGYTDQLLEEDNINAEQKDQLERISAASFRLLDMINQSLSLFKMEQGTYRMDPQEVELLAIVRNVTGETKGYASSKELQVEVRVGEELVREGEKVFVRGEELLCYTILANLVKNAVEASPIGQKLTISLLTDKPETNAIAIHNQGVVPEEIRDSFFEKYATSGKKHGTGLGTYSARLMTLAQGGEMTMHTSEEDGTTVTVTLPKEGRD